MLSAFASTSSFFECDLQFWKKIHQIRFDHLAIYPKLVHKVKKRKTESNKRKKREVIRKIQGVTDYEVARRKPHITKSKLFSFTATEAKLFSQTEKNVAERNGKERLPSSEVASRI